MALSLEFGGGGHYGRARVLRTRTRRKNPKDSKSKQGCVSGGQDLQNLSGLGLARGGTAGCLPGQRGRFARRFHPFFDRAQVPETLRKHYFGQRALFLVEVDGDALGGALRWERSRNEELFPHLYGELDLGAVLSVMNLNMRSDGGHDVPELMP
jgi:uncharacterized protein (DUF952 family)